MTSAAWWLRLLLLSGLAGDAGTQGQQPFRISVKVDLVVLPVTVRDRKGEFVAGLSERDFAVYEDGVRQSIKLFRHEDVPVTVGLVIDHSGSMRQKLTEVIAAARTFVRSSSPDDEMFAVNFNERVTFGLPGEVRFTNRPDELARAISRMPAEGTTALYDAIFAARLRLETGTRDKKVLIVISDGGDTSSRHNLDEALKAGERSGALVYAIGIFDPDDPDRNPGVLKRLARATGGEAYFPERLETVVAVCERIARDIRNQYTIGYVSTNAARAGAYMAIKVVVQPDRLGKLSVRTRTGYIAGSELRSVMEESAK